MMNYDELRKKHHNAALRSPPWPETPGGFLCQLEPSGAVDPYAANFSGMMSAIVHARELWKPYAATHRLRVTSSDGSELFKGNL